MLINKKAVKRFSLDCARNQRIHKFTRVSNDFLERVEFKMREYIRKEIQMLPSVGKTII